MDDLISRQAAITALSHMCSEDEKGITVSRANVDSMLKSLLPAQPERKVGKWTEDNACEFCGFKPWYERDIHTLSYCPNCGADMRGEQDE